MADKDYKDKDSGNDTTPESSTNSENTNKSVDGAGEGQETFGDDNEASESATESVPEDLSETTKNSLERYDEFYKKILAKEAEELEDAKKDAEQNVHKDDKAILFKIGAVYAVLVVSLAIIVCSVIGCVKACVYADRGFFCNIYIVVGALCLNVLTLVVSSAWAHWNYYHRKKLLLFVIIVLAAIAFFQIIFSLISVTIVPLLLLPEPNKWVTPSKWMFLIRCVTIFPSLLLLVYFVTWEFEVVFEPFALELVLKFRILLHIDIRSGKKYRYDARIARQMKNGLRWTLRENDRYLHVLINGQSGTAKTSSIIIPMINGDLLTRCRNEDRLKRVLWKRLTSGKLRLNRHLTNGTFGIDAFSPMDANDNKTKNELKALKKKHRLAGMTVIGPDDSLSDAAYELCVNKGIPCNRVDPVPEKGTANVKKKGFKGFNPLYISSRIPEHNKMYEVVKRAALFADVMQGINDMKGKGDPYFNSINRSMTVNFSIMLGITMPDLDGRQPTPADVQYLINNFGKVKKYQDALEKYNKKLTGEQTNALGFVLDYLKNDITGDGADKMKEQSRGLRNIMNEFLTNPLIRRTLCAAPKDTIDMDAMLAEGQITVVNYAMEFGASDSLGFGQFLLLSFFNAVYRRGGAEGAVLAPHVLIVDELPVIIHPAFEQAVSLFRKYKVSIVGCLQSLDQMEKNENTKYLKKVLKGVATHYLFGRCGEQEIQSYQNECGKVWVPMTQTSVSETSITDDDPSYSYSTRESLQQVNVLEGASMRNKGFQEVTMLTVVDSNIIPHPVDIKVDFLKNEEKNWKKREIKKYKWEDYWGTITPEDINMESISLKEATKALSQTTDERAAQGMKNSDSGEISVATSDDVEQNDEPENEMEEVVYNETSDNFDDDDDDDDDVLLSSGVGTGATIVKKKHEEKGKSEENYGLNFSQGFMPRKQDDDEEVAYQESNSNLTF